MKSEHLRIDATRSSAVVICTCGWRDVATSPQVAARMGVDHEAQCHPHQRQAYDLARAATRRAARG